MDITNSTILIAGGTSGLGLGIARRLARAGSTVIIGGRRTGLLASIAAESPELGTVEIDVTDPESVLRARDAVLAAHPALDTVVTMSGIMAVEDLRDPAHVATAEATIATNLLGTIRVVDAFTPHLLGRGAGTIVTVSSGLAFVPYPLTPTYSATKAGVHSYTEALRAQLAGTGVRVAELIPPLVATTLLNSQDNPYAMPVDDFVEESVALLATNPTPREITVERVLAQRNAVTDGTYDALFATLAGHLTALGH